MPSTPSVRPARASFSLAPTFRTGHFPGRNFGVPTSRMRAFRGAVLDGVDLSGANLTGADFTDATLSITGVGADFTRAVFTGADLQGSDLRGAVFASADLTGSKMTSLPGGLTLGYLDGARLGCNVLYGSPGVTITNVTIIDDCRTLKAFNRVTFAGSFYAADLTNMDFSSVLVEATDFRLAKMSGVNLADYGVFPAADFSGAQLVDADLSNVGFYDTTFVGTNLTGTNLDGVSVVGSDFSGANFEFVSMVGFSSQRSRYVDAMFNEVDLTDASLSFDNFERAIFGQIVATNLVIDTISCPGAISTSRYGLCTVGNDVAF